jgi:predicted MFS family arabinose efflux permease
MMLVSSGVRKAVFTCLAIYFFTVATGFSVISYHAKAILMQANVGEAIDANLGIIIIGVCKMAGNIVSALVIDKIGRKTLLYVSSVFICISQAALGTYFHLQVWKFIQDFVVSVFKKYF